MILKGPLHKILSFFLGLPVLMSFMSSQTLLLILYSSSLCVWS